MTVAVDAEITALMLCLQRQRNHVLGAVEGLSDEALRRPVLPSGWSCLGMVQHLTLSVERLWFRAVVAGDPVVIDQVGSQVSAWQVDPGTDRPPTSLTAIAMRLPWRMPSSPPHPPMPTWPGGPFPGVSGACTIFEMSCSM